MIFTDYYRFEKQPEQKSKLRMDCTASTGSYEPLEMLRKKGKLFVYFGRNYTGNEKAEFALSRTGHISSVFVPKTEQAMGVWYGDMKGTGDVLLIKPKGFQIVDGAPDEGAILDVYIARGQVANRHNLCNEVVDGVYDDEMRLLREIAKPDGGDTQLEMFGNV